MKSLIKSSFLLVLLLGIFSMGNAYAENPNTSKTITKTGKRKIVKAMTIRCKTHTMADISMILTNRTNNSLTFMNVILLYTCKPENFQNGNWVLVIHKDCSIERHKIDPFES